MWGTWLSDSCSSIQNPKSPHFSCLYVILGDNNATFQGNDRDLQRWNGWYLLHESQECYRNSHKAPNLPELPGCSFKRESWLSMTNRTAHITSTNSSEIWWEKKKITEEKNKSNPQLTIYSKNPLYVDSVCKVSFLGCKYCWSPI